MAGVLFCEASHAAPSVKDDSIVAWSGRLRTMGELVKEAALSYPLDPRKSGMGNGCNSAN
jgi:hypothetical protein